MNGFIRQFGPNFGIILDIPGGPERKKMAKKKRTEESKKLERNGGDKSLQMKGNDEYGSPEQKHFAVREKKSKFSPQGLEPWSRHKLAF